MLASRFGVKPVLKLVEREAKAPATTEQESSASKSTVTAIEKHHDAAFMQVANPSGKWMSREQGIAMEVCRSS